MTLAYLPNAAEASKVTGYFKVTIPNRPQATQPLAGMNDLELFVPKRALMNTAVGKKVRYMPAGGGNQDIGGDEPTQTNSNAGSTWRYEFPPINPQGGDMFKFYVRHMATGFKGARMSFTKDGAKIPIGGVTDFYPGVFVDGNNGHIVEPSQSFSFGLTFHNATFDGGYPGPAPLVFSKLRLFTDVDFGQTTFDEATAAMDTFLDFNDPAYPGELFDMMGDPLRLPPGTEVDLPTLLAGFPGWDPIAETYTLATPDAVWPSFILQDVLGIVMLIGETTYTHPVLGPMTADFAMAHQVSKVIPEPASFALVIGATCSAWLILRRIRPTTGCR